MYWDGLIQHKGSGGLRLWLPMSTPWDRCGSLISSLLRPPSVLRLSAPHPGPPFKMRPNARPAAQQRQVIGPRHAFAEARQLEGRVAGTDGRWDLAALATGEDVAYVEALGGSINEYEGFRVAFEVGNPPPFCPRRTAQAVWWGRASNTGWVGICRTAHQAVPARGRGVRVWCPWICGEGGRRVVRA
jgi:hypothetical protein